MAMQVFFLKTNKTKQAWHIEDLISSDYPVQSCSPIFLYEVIAWIWVFIPNI